MTFDTNHKGAADDGVSGIEGCQGASGEPLESDALPAAGKCAERRQDSEMQDLAVNDQAVKATGAVGVLGAPAARDDGRDSKEDGEEEEQEEEEEEEEEDDSDDSYVPLPWKGGGSNGSEDDDLRIDPADPDKGLHACVLKLRADALRDRVAAEPSLLQEVDKLGRTPLHVALMKGHPDLVGVLLSVQDAEAVGRALQTPFRGAHTAGKDTLPMLHLALSVAPFQKTAESALQCLKLLLAHCPPLDINETDNAGRTVLHLACSQGSAHVLDTLLQHRADPGACDDLGQWPLHHAIDSRSQLCVQKLLACSDPALLSGGLHPLYRCIDRQAWCAALLVHKQGWPVPSGLLDFAAARGVASEWSFVSEKAGEGSWSLEELQWPSEIFGAASTAVVTHPVCLGHSALPLDVDDPVLRHRLMRQIPENPHRLEVLCGERGILRSDGFRDLRWVSEPPRAPLADLLRVHDDWYVHKLMERVQETHHLGPFDRLPLDGGDTKVTRESWDAALRACGCVLEAVELVCKKQVRNAFCAVRPPGHHLGPSGACNTKDLKNDPEGSQGFCLMNNVAVGAAYARCVYRHIIRKVAIVDFDVHHGNGTEAVVRHVKWRSETSEPQEFLVRGVSVKLAASFPASCKPWLDPESDPESILFASIHGYGGGFYPGTGSNCNEASPKIINVALQAKATSADFRDGVRTQILPELLAFDPDILFVSAGFDGHEDDLIGNCRCVEEDYVWVTKQLMSVANRCCQGRLISVLEGGYNTRAETLSPFAQSVAGHVRTLMHTSPNFCHLECEARLSNGSALREVDQRQAAGRVEAKLARRKRKRDVGEAVQAKEPF